MALKNGWKVVNAVNRDVERQHLNRILEEIRQRIEERDTAGGGDASDIQATVGKMVEGNTETGIAVTYDAAKRVLDFVVSNFVIRLSGDVSGQGEVNGLSSVTIPVTIDPNKIGIGEAPQDGQAYWRRDGSWQAVGTALDQLQYFDGGGFTVLAGGGEWHARIIQGTDTEIDVANGDVIDGDVTLSLAEEVRYVLQHAVTTESIPEDGDILEFNADVDQWVATKEPRSLRIDGGNF